MMIKRLALFLFIGITSGCYSQTFLTNAQVYDFDIGDIIQGRYYHAGDNVFTYETKTILNKTFSSANDTIFYSIQIDHYITALSSCNSCTTSTNSSIITQTVTNLNLPAVHNNLTSICHGTMDSTFIDYCGKTVWGKFPKMGVGCGPGQDRLETYLVAGLGGPYYYYVTTYNLMSLQWMDYKLTYYSKVTGSCGSLVTTGVKEELNQNIDLVVAPNPFSTVTYISFGKVGIKADLNIYNLLGVLVKTVPVSSSSIQELNRENLSSGVYYLELKEINRSSFVGKLIVNE